MTDIDTLPAPSSAAPDPWEADLARLRARFPKANASVLICIHALQQEVDVSLEDMRARAALHGIRITAASLLAARRALGLSPPLGPRRRKAAVDEGTAEGQEVEADEERAPVRRRSAGVESGAGGVEQMLRAFVAGAEEERTRLREAVRRVIEVVDGALG